MGSSPSIPQLSIAGAPPPDPPTRRVRLYSCSDLHCDHGINRDIVQSWAPITDADDDDDDDDAIPTVHVLLVAGDISQHLWLVREVLLHLRSKFDRVFFCPGNNELRLTRAERERADRSPHRGDEDRAWTSLDKQRDVLRMCEEIGVDVAAALVEGMVWVVPLLSWYSEGFASGNDADAAHVDDEYRRRWLDFRTVRWPRDMQRSDQVAQHCAQLNVDAVQRVQAADSAIPVVTLSHFLPRYDFLPALSLYRKPSLALVTGDVRIEQQLRSVRSRVHVFGHSHVDVDKEVDGVRYVQRALGHPRERKQWWKSAAVEQLRALCDIVYS